MYRALSLSSVLVYSAAHCCVVICVLYCASISIPIFHRLECGLAKRKDRLGVSLDAKKMANFSKRTSTRISNVIWNVFFETNIYLNYAQFLAITSIPAAVAVVL